MCLEFKKLKLKLRPGLYFYDGVFCKDVTESHAVRVCFHTCTEHERPLGGAK